MSICSRSQTNHCIAQPTFVNINGQDLAMRRCCSMIRRHVRLAAMSCIAYSHITNTEIIVLSGMRKGLWMTHDQAEWWLSRVPRVCFRPDICIFPPSSGKAPQHRGTLVPLRTWIEFARKRHSSHCIIHLAKPHNQTLKCERAGVKSKNEVRADSVVDAEVRDLRAYA